MPRRHFQSIQRSSTTTESLTKQLCSICTRNFNATTCVNFIVMGVYYLIFVTGTEYVRNAYATSLSVAGLSSGVMVIGCLMGRFVCGNIIGIAGCRLMLVVGLLVFTIANAALFFIHSLGAVFTSRFIAGVSVGIVGTVTATIVALVVPACKKGFGISIFSMSTVLALALGPFAGLLLSQVISYEIMTLGLMALILLSLAGLLFLRELPPVRHRLRPIFQLRSYIDPRVTRFSTMIFVAFLGYGCLQAFMATYAKAFDLTDSASLFFPIYAASAFASRPFTGRQLDQYGENRIIYPLLALLTAAFLIMGLSGTSFALLASAVLFGLGYGNLQSIGQAVAVSMVTPSRFAHATSTFFIFMDFGIGLGPYVFGFVIPYAGYQTMFTLLATTTAFSSFLYYWLHGRRAGK
ncbi:MAG: MFS transporter [Desulfovibrio sp.]|nr:MFS transporter [Desulfovibrio sp.]